MTVRLQRDDFDAAAEAAAITRSRTDIGAVVTFTGICRDHEAGQGVTAAEVETLRTILSKIRGNLDGDEAVSGG